MDQPDDFGQGARMIAAAVIAAVVTAATVITVGQAVIDRSEPAARPHADAHLIRTAG